MSGIRLGGLGLTCLIFLSGLALLPGLGSSRRLTYHEAFVAQGVREMLNSGNWVYPSIGGLPWLEKPPLPWWLVGAVAHGKQGVTETTARLPSALAAVMLVLGVALIATPHYGAWIGLLAGAVQATTAWTVIRGRLAEADIILACLITWAILALDRLFADKSTNSLRCTGDLADHKRLWLWTFMVLLGATCLVKGIGFGALLVLSVVGGVLLWERNLILVRRLQVPMAWGLALVIGLGWPLLVIILQGHGVLSLWAMHVSNRLIQQRGPGPFAGEAWWEYITSLFGQALPWTPLVLIGAGQSLVRALTRGKYVNVEGSPEGPAVIVAGDRLLWVWGVVPLAILTLAPVRNAHYAISTQVPWSIWAALGLARLGERLRCWGFEQRLVIRGTCIGFTGLALAYGLAFCFLGRHFDRRGIEWAFYEVAGCQIPPAMPVALLYDDWDRNPYESPFGRIPHDLAVRLFYLRRSACWHMEPTSLLLHEHFKGRCFPITSCSVNSASSPDAEDNSIAVIARDRDRPALQQLGEVEIITQGPSLRPDRTYTLFRVTFSRRAVPHISRVTTRAID